MLRGEGTIVSGNEEDEVHYWNRFPGGLEIDLTREQFRSHRIIGEPPRRRTSRVFPPGHVVLGSGAWLDRGVPFEN